jgi:hypothetical protein
MTKIAAIIGAVLFLAGAALAGTLTSLGSSNTPTIGQSFAPASSTTRQDDRGREDELRGRENELRGRENEAGEDLRGPCDEAEHANDPRCTGATVPVDDGDEADEINEVGDDHGRDDRGDRSGPSERSGHGGGDDGGHSGRGGGDDD